MMSHSGQHSGKHYVLRIITVYTPQLPRATLVPSCCEFPMRAIRAIFPTVLICVFLAGCATKMQGGPMENDPLEGFNRAMFNFTIGVDKAVLRPTALVYRRAVPVAVRLSVRNFLFNLNSPVIL